MNKEELKQLIEIFHAKWQNTNELWKNDFFSKISEGYKDYSIKVSFGQGKRITAPKSPWIAFLKYNQQVSEGIYPSISIDLQQKSFITNIGVSHENKPKVEQQLIKEIQDKTKVGEFHDVDKLIERLDANMEIFDRRMTSVNLQSNFSSTVNYCRIKNIILYGSPGVGKTHNTNKLISLIESGMYSEKEIFEAIKENTRQTIELDEDIKSRTKFVTFHQSFDYEDFIEGFRPNEEGKIELVDGLFKQISKEAVEQTIASNLNKILYEKIQDMSEQPKVWKLSLGQGGEIKDDCFKNDCIRLGWDNYGDLDKLDTINQRELKDFYNLRIGDIIFAFRNQWEIDGVGIVVGNYIFDDSYFEYKHKRDVKWVLKDKIVNIKDYNADTRMTLSTLYRLNRISKQNVLEILKINQEKTIDVIPENKNFYLVIDEINRGNISKIFGELITLIEESKRDRLEVILPYSKQPFKIPSNLYIIGTMNSSDKSIALIDIALRRRFTFLKMEPNADLIDDNEAKALFIALNEYIKKSHLGEDYQIGHSYFMGIESSDDLDFVWEYKIKPLLEEYFYGDKEGLDEVENLYNEAK